MTSMFKNWRTTSERIEKFLSNEYFTDVNIYGRIIADTKNVEEIHHFLEVTQPPLSSKESPLIYDKTALSVSDILCATIDQWNEVDTRTFSFGPTWSVHWFRVRISVPDAWIHTDQHEIEFHWNSECEVLVFAADGRPVAGLNSTHRRTSIVLSDIINSSRSNTVYNIYLQASCSDLFGAGDGGFINPPNTNKFFKIDQCKLVLISLPVRRLYRDMKLLLEIAEALKDTERGYQALYAANEAINTVVNLKIADLHDKVLKALEVMSKFFSEVNGTSQVTLHAIGNCHIDTAWLWRFTETRRKIARSWSTTARLITKYPGMKFACSQAQQMDWLKVDYPSLFEELKILTKKDNFIPVGGTWVEFDTNIPCAESICRQFLYGQTFFMENFGAYCSEFWLPDTFGYSPQLPQMMVSAGLSHFVTQKLSWSLVNKFPHHTFIWQGLDGTRVIAHFPPGDSYTMEGKVSEMVRSITQFADKGRCKSMLYLYGHGDGGQGPTDDMLYRIERLKNCDGLPKVEHSSIDQFFSTIDTANICTWVGELFLELHHGTYTSQRQIKLGNVHSEGMLRLVEMLLCMASFLPDDSCGELQNIIGTFTGPLEDHWKLILLCQFHDVLPGSSIKDVCDDAYYIFRSVINWCITVSRKLLSVMGIDDSVLINPLSWPIILTLEDGIFQLPAFSVSSIKDRLMASGSLGYEYDVGLNIHRLWNKYFTVTIDEHCRIVELINRTASQLGNHFVKGSFANDLWLYDDVPLYWDAWDVMDYHLETGTPLSDVASYKILECVTVSKNDHSVTISAKLGLLHSGTIICKLVTVFDHIQYLQICTKVEYWGEVHKMLKVVFPIAVPGATNAFYRTQAGFHSRPVHRNTSWDAAKYEVCSHEWICIGDTNWGVALLKDAIFGSSASYGTVHLSLLRSPMNPDSQTDKFYLPHIFQYALYPYCATGTPFGLINALAAQFCWTCLYTNEWQSVVSTTATTELPTVFSFPVTLETPSNGDVSIDWLKPKSHFAVVMRLHELSGGRHWVRLSSQRQISRATFTNIIETVDEQEGIHCVDNYVGFLITPFKIVSLIIEFC